METQLKSGSDIYWYCSLAFLTAWSTHIAVPVTRSRHESADERRERKKAVREERKVRGREGACTLTYALMCVHVYYGTVCAVISMYVEREGERVHRENNMQIQVFMNLDFLCLWQISKKLCH